MPISMTPSAKNLIVLAPAARSLESAARASSSRRSTNPARSRPHRAGSARSAMLTRDVRPPERAAAAIDVDVVEGRGSLLHPRDAGARPARAWRGRAPPGALRGSRAGCDGASSPARPTRRGCRSVSRRPAAGCGRAAGRASPPSMPARRSASLLTHMVWWSLASSTTGRSRTAASSVAASPMPAGSKEGS